MLTPPEHHPVDGHPAGRELLLIGIGAGDPDWVTIEAVRAIEGLDVLFVVLKQDEMDELVQARRTVVERHRSAPLRTVELRDPPRPWRTARDYDAAVTRWRAERLEQWSTAVAAELHTARAVASWSGATRASTRALS